jgi:Na+-translocating ferredoxin:NAD+ oxidoreductase RnfD subunit
MPQPDPIPSLRRSQWQRFRRIMRWMSVASILAAAAAVYFVTQGESETKIHMLIATALGAGLTVLLGAALMSLVFISSGSGHDEEAHRIADETLIDKDEL